MRTCLLFELIYIVTSFVSCAASHRRFGYTANSDESAVITTLLRTSYDMCHKACLARKRCLAFELTIRSNMCRMFSVDTTTSGVSMVQKPGAVYTEKRNWDVQTLDESCTDNCMEGDTCSTDTNPPQCSPQECPYPPPLDANSVIMGNIRSIGSRIVYVCNNDNTKMVSSVCQNDSATWSAATLQCSGCDTTLLNGQLTDVTYTAVGATTAYTCLPGFYRDEPTVTCLATSEWGPGKCYPLATSLAGSRFKIIDTETLDWWHFDPSVTEKRVTIMWQSNDNYVKFQFEEVEPGLYKFKSVATQQYMFDRGDFLNGLENPDDDRQRFWVFKEADTTYRIITKATGRYVRVKTNKYVSSQENIKDARSLYTLEPV